MSWNTLPIEMKNMIYWRCDVATRINLAKACKDLCEKDEAVVLGTKVLKRKRALVTSITKRLERFNDNLLKTIRTQLRAGIEDIDWDDIIDVDNLDLTRGKDSFEYLIFTTVLDEVRYSWGRWARGLTQLVDPRDDALNDMVWNGVTNECNKMWTE